MVGDLQRSSIECAGGESQCFKPKHRSRCGKLSRGARPGQGSPIAAFPHGDDQPGHYQAAAARPRYPAAQPEAPLPRLPDIYRLYLPLRCDLAAGLVRPYPEYRQIGRLRGAGQRGGPREHPPHRPGRCGCGLLSTSRTGCIKATTGFYSSRLSDSLSI